MNAKELASDIVNDITNDCEISNFSSVEKIIQKSIEQFVSEREGFIQELISKLDNAEQEWKYAKAALETISRSGYGLDMSDSSQDAEEYWADQTLKLREIARKALDAGKVG